MYVRVCMCALCFSLFFIFIILVCFSIAVVPLFCLFYRPSLRIRVRLSIFFFFHHSRRFGAVAALESTFFSPSLPQQHLWRLLAEVSQKKRLQSL